MRTEPQLQADSDRDGLSDVLEQRLLEQFAPRFLVAAHDCSTLPAEFKTGQVTPEPEADNGTIYGQVFPFRGGSEHGLLAEVHYYHLWRRDCGGHGHPLDTEHVAVLVRASGMPLATATWTALYWYAAAHENTVCDVSQIARASTLRAQAHGATVWISPGKHASFLNKELCRRGCGADRCEDMVPLQTTALINLGEVGHTMNGSLFVSSLTWPLAAKMSTSNFPDAPIARLNQLPASDIAWFRPGRHPAQGVIAHSSSTEQAIAGGGRDTSAALSQAGDATAEGMSTAGDSTAAAISVAGDSTGNALQKSYRDTRHALGMSVRHVGSALHLTPGNQKGQPR